MDRSSGNDSPPERLTPELVLVCPELREAAIDQGWDERPGTAEGEAESGEEASSPATAFGGPPLRLAIAPPAGPVEDTREPPERAKETRPGLLRGLAGSFPLLPLTVLAFVCLLATAAVTLAWDSEPSLEREAPSSRQIPQPKVLLVPDVRRQPFVFAKGILEDAGFAWLVEGEVQGYAANLVVAQRPDPGARVTDTGAPTVVLRLVRNPDYEERGVPQNSSRYAGTALAFDEEGGLASPEEALPTTAAPPARAAVTLSQSEAGQSPAAKPVRKAKRWRRPDFHLPGAPREPANEIPLTNRAFLLASWLANQPKPTRRVLKYWSWQHAWIVAGARFGWKDGAEALRILIEIDRDLQERWRIGAESEAVARAALQEVKRRAKAG